MSSATARTRFLLSLPERIVRSLSALSAGLIREIGEVVLPASLRRTSLYQTMVDVALRFMIEEVGQVEDAYPTVGELADGFLLKRATSHGIELLGILTFHASPIWILAALADATGGGRTIIREIAQALKEEGLLDAGATFETVDQMLEGLERTSAHLATTLNLPPLNIAGLRSEWVSLQSEMQSIPPRNLPPLEAIERVWKELGESAQSQGRSVFVLSSMIAVSTVAAVPANLLRLSRAARTAARRTGKVLGVALLDHYVLTIGEISRMGIPDYWRREFQPYLRAAAQQFAPEKESLTERWLSRKG